jgi:hypothetical protein
MKMLVLMIHFVHGLKGICKKIKLLLIIIKIKLIHSGYKLSINENMSKIEPLDDKEAKKFEKIVYLPIRATSDFYLLGDVKSFQDIVYPGIYQLFEKIKIKQKNQMFGMLNTTSKALMTDLHNEFIRTFKFIGK